MLERLLGKYVIIEYHYQKVLDGIDGICTGLIDEEKSYKFIEVFNEERGFYYLINTDNIDCIGYRDNKEGKEYEICK